MRERGVAIWDIPREREEDAELFSPAQLSVDGIDQVSDARGFTGLINQWLRDDIGADRKQLHTAKHVFDRLHEEHSFTGDYTIVKNYMRERERRSREMFVLLSHPPGEAMVVIGGVEGLVGYRRRNFMAPMPVTRRADGSIRRYWCATRSYYSVPVAYGHRDVWLRG